MLEVCPFKSFLLQEDLNNFLLWNESANTFEMISNSSKHHFKSFPIRGGYVEVSAKQKITLSTDNRSFWTEWMGEGVENVNLLDFKHTHGWKCNFEVLFSNFVIHRQQFEVLRKVLLLLLPKKISFWRSRLNFCVVSPKFNKVVGKTHMVRKAKFVLQMSKLERRTFSKDRIPMN